MIRAIIGSGYGDEGKGLITDYFSSKDSITIRFNGGSQAGHTILQDNVRFVFHHFGSGTIVGAPTFLSKYFIVNPVFYFKEFEELQGKLKIPPIIYIDSRCLVTTPFDIMLNEIIEDHRTKKHGSCGCGINETVERNNVIPLMISDNDIRKKLLEIRGDYFLKRLKKFDAKISPLYQKHLENDKIIDRFISQFEEMKKLIVPNPEKLLQEHSLVFEGAQGLMLDQSHEFFPYVTRSNTGIKNVTEILKEFNLKEKILIYYVMRCYATRHGEGPFPGEISEKPFEKISDETNIPNRYQGTLRFGILNLDIIKKAIDKDLQNAPENYEKNIVVTCLDQHNGTIPYIQEEVQKSASEKNFISIVMEHFGVDRIFLSYGPSKDKVIYKNLRCHGERGESFGDNCRLCDIL